jgi:hypothetical protein
VLLPFFILHITAFIHAANFTKHYVIGTHHAAASVAAHASFKYISALSNGIIRPRHPSLCWLVLPVSRLSNSEHITVHLSLNK